jgi:anti-sigma factor RsiW
MTICVHEDILQAWLDGELAPAKAAEVRAHLANCAACTGQADEAAQAMALMSDAWQAELPEFVPTASLRARLAETLSTEPAPGFIDRLRAAFMRWEVATVVAVLVIALAVVLTNSLRQPVVPLTADIIQTPLPKPFPTAQETNPAEPVRPAAQPRRAQVIAVKRVVPKLIPAETQLAEIPSAPKPVRQASLWEVETGRHLEQTQLLLRAFRNANDEAAADLSYERELSRELLTRNRLLRRSAEPKADARAEELLNDIEPLLLDIANLPERVALADVRSLKELIREQQVIPALQLYAGKRGY